MLNFLKKSNTIKIILVSMIIFNIIVIFISLINTKNNYIHYVSILIFNFLIFLGTTVKLDIWLKTTKSKTILKKTIQIILALFIIILLTIFLNISELTIISLAIIASIVFTIVMMLFSIFLKDKNDRDLSLNILKNFFAVFILMSVMVYNIVTYAINLENDYHKEKISFYQQTNYLNEYLIKDYKKFIDSKLTIFNVNDKKKEINLFTKIPPTIIIITALFLAIQFINNLSFFNIKNTKYIFQNQKVNKHIRNS